jgi:cob(I)alamin adenosyltransferase
MSVESDNAGLVEVFTGNGKGKTSAALGIALRASGHGMRVHVIHFMKGDYPYGERKTLTLLPGVTSESFGLTEFCNPNDPSEEQKEQAQQGLKAAREAVLSGGYDIVVLDEINVAVAWKLLAIEDVMKLIEEKPAKLELILTGRYADPKLIERADLVTEMVEVKHPFRKGVRARQGIEY